MLRFEVIFWATASNLAFESTGALIDFTGVEVYFTRVKVSAQTTHSEQVAPHMD
jgi:hypothetical protein